MSKALEIKNQIHALIEEYHKEVFKPKHFIGGESHVPVSGKVFDHKEIQYITDAALDAWFTTGRFNTEFEKKLAKFINVKSVLTVNSGSSANLVAFSALTAEELGDKAIKAGDEVITVAASFPTTINPMIQYGIVPVFLDITLPTYEMDVEKLEQALSPKTKAVMVAHTLGNVFDVGAVRAFCDKHKLWLIEDCCDALGATYNGKHVGTFGDIGTLSFYPAHHITMGEGGAVFTGNAKLKKIMESFRDWGRDCWCETGKDNTCGKRFAQQLGDLPFGYDHKYTYSRHGFNLKITDMQAALGLAQLEKLESFIETRRKNFDLLTKELSRHEDKLILPKATPNANPSWFGYLITIKPDAGITRDELIAAFNKKNIGTRLLFAGDIRKQPYFKNYNYRSIGDLKNTDLIVSNTFWIGVTPMVTEEMIQYVGKCFDEALKK
ncbi:MAG: lipopolysaccharide biosynthesis protein RfbH [Bacteroidetes bacterium]|nr:lipopolysaccharide biosynthesis protein RfbH [Bacteroidota bacterium]